MGRPDLDTRSLPDSFAGVRVPAHVDEEGAPFLAADQLQNAPQQRLEEGHVRDLTHVADLLDVSTQPIPVAPKVEGTVITTNSFTEGLDKTQPISIIPDHTPEGDA